MSIRDRAQFLLSRGWQKERGWNFYHQPTDSKVEVITDGKMKVNYKKGKLQVNGRVFSDYDQLMVYLVN